MASCCIRECTSHISNSNAVVEFFQLSSINISDSFIEAFCQKNHNGDIDQGHICSAHFEEEAFVTELKTADFVRILREDAVPTLQLPKETNDLKTYEELLRIKEENDLLAEQLKTEQSAIEALEKIILEKKLELKNVKKQIAAQASDEPVMDLNTQRQLLSKVFSRSQIRVLSGKKKTHWKDDDMAVGYTIRHLSNKRAYMYITQKLNIPLPGLSSIKKWVAHKKSKTDVAVEK